MPLRPIIASSLLLLALSAVPTTAQQQSGKVAAVQNTLTASEQKAGWKLLFDGTTITGWRGYKSDSVPAEWHVENGTLTKSKPAKEGYLHRAGRWNRTRIVVSGNHVEHWLNGHRMVSYTLGSKGWTARVKKSKFAAYPNYGKASEGYIAIQGEHDGALWLRNIKIKVLP